jgi:hypothetical protein
MGYLIEALIEFFGPISVIVILVLMIIGLVS